jgi:hypothetical protein
MKKYIGALVVQKLGLAVLYVAYVRRVLPYVYMGVLYVYSPPCTIVPVNAGPRIYNPENSCCFLSE